jgi:hypothetical protein
MQKSLIGLSILVAAGTVHAGGYSHDDMVSLDGSLKDVAPDPGVARAIPRAPGWCARVPAETGYSIGGFEGALEQTEYTSSILRAAKMICSFPGNEKGVQHAAAIIAQNWMNSSGLSQADAELTIGLRLDADTYAAGKTKLCKALGLPPEADEEDADPQDEEGLFRKTRMHLFGCDANSAAWMDDSNMSWHDMSAAFFDQSVTAPDQIVRLGYVLNRAKRGFEDPKLGNEKKYLTPYGADSIDYRELSDAGVRQMIEVAPYKGNAYAKATILESLAHARLGISLLETRAQALVKDPDYKEALIDAPKRAVDEYNASAKSYAAEIARSNQFEHDSHSPKRVAGCEPTLRADFLKVYGTLKHATKDEALASLSDPVASLLLQRLVGCMSITKEGVAADLEDLRLNKVRYARGPRSAAYFAIVDAIEKIHAERPKFPLSRDLLAGEETVIGGGTKGVESSGVQNGIVKTATKKGDLVHVVFVTTKVQVMNSTCVSTNHLLSIASDGTLYYEQRCHDTGLAWQDTTPSPCDVPSNYATGIAPNSYAEITGAGMPVVVYKDKTKAKLLAFYSFPL